MLGFGLNQVTMIHAPIDTFVDAAARLGLLGVELRNDLGRPLFDGLSAAQIRRRLGDNGLRLLGVSQVCPFNRWSDAIADDVQALIESATEAGAEAISLIPCNDGTGLDGQTRRGELSRALEACLPMLEAADMVANVEPLGFESSSLRSKEELIAAIAALGARDRFRLVHDTFHHTLAGGGPIFAESTGIVHISGVSDPGVGVAQMKDEHRVLIDAGDRLENLEQITLLQASGYRGAYSIECFAPEIHAKASLEDAIRASITFISSHVQDMAV